MIEVILKKDGVEVFNEKAVMVILAASQSIESEVGAFNVRSTVLGDGSVELVAGMHEDLGRVINSAIEMSMEKSDLKNGKE